MGILGVSILLFADDIVILAKDSKELQSLLDVVYVYSVEWKFRFNSNKSKVMVFGSKRDLDHPLFLGSNRLGLGQVVKYLEVDLVSTLSWKEFHKNLILRAKKNMSCDWSYRKGVIS